MRRFSAYNDKYQWKKYLGNTIGTEEFILNRNISVGERANIIIGLERTVVQAKWGFLIGSPTKAHRIPFVEAHQAHILPSFRMLFRNQRGILLADSYYGWEDQVKRPYRILRKDKHPLLIAVLFQGIEDQKNFVILYRKARSEIPFLKKEPMLLDVNTWKFWLNTISVDKTIEFIKNQTLPKLKTYTVSNKILIRGNNDPEVHLKQIDHPSLF